MVGGGVYEKRLLLRIARRAEHYPRHMFSFRRSRPPLRVVLYSKPGCHLCEVMKADLKRAKAGARYELTEVDIESDPELTERFALSIPVLEIEGRVAFKGKLTPEAFIRKLDRASR
jgi:glutaredoxin